MSCVPVAGHNRARDNALLYGVRVRPSVGFLDDRNHITYLTLELLRAKRSVETLMITHISVRGLLFVTVSKINLESVEIYSLTNGKAVFRKLSFPD